MQSHGICRILFNSLAGLMCCIVFSGCSETQSTRITAGEGAPVFDQTYLDPTQPNYMSGPAQIHITGPENIYLEDEELEEFKVRLRGFLETNNNGEFERHFREFYIPESFPTDSLLDLYATMYFRWDSIGVTNRFDDWWVRYISPFAEGELYDVALAEISFSHHQIFQKRWTGNFRNFGRSFKTRYPRFPIKYMDTTYVEENGDTALHRRISVDAERTIYLLRSHETDSLHDSKIRFLNDGGQNLPQLAEFMDSAAFAFVEDHRRQFGIFVEEPVESER